MQYIFSFLKKINRFLRRLFELAYLKMPCLSILKTGHSILGTRNSNFESLELQDKKIEFGGLSQDCQLTFELYCIRGRIFIQLCLGSQPDTSLQRVFTHS